MEMENKPTPEQMERAEACADAQGVQRQNDWWVAARAGALSAILQSDQQQAELRAAAIALRDDMLMRAERDKHLHDGELVVEAGAGAWLRFNRAIDRQYQEGRKDG